MDSRGTTLEAALQDALAQHLLAVEKQVLIQLTQLTPVALKLALRFGDQR